MEQHLSEDLLLDVGGEGAGLGPGVLGAGLLRGADLPHARLVTHLLLEQEHGISNTALNESTRRFHNRGEGPHKDKGSFEALI